MVRRMPVRAVGTAGNAVMMVGGRRQAGGRAACAQKMLADPADQEARYHFACCAAIENDYETALQEWLQILERKPSHDKAKDAMVAVFHLLGREDELVTSYQRKLYQALH